MGGGGGRHAAASTAAFAAAGAVREASSSAILLGRRIPIWNEACAAPSEHRGKLDDRPIQICFILVWLRGATKHFLPEKTQLTLGNSTSDRPAFGHDHLRFWLNCSYLFVIIRKNIRQVDLRYFTRFPRYAIGANFKLDKTCVWFFGSISVVFLPTEVYKNVSEAFWTPSNILKSKMHKNNVFFGNLKNIF